MAEGHSDSSDSNGYIIPDIEETLNRFCPVVRIIQPYMPHHEEAFEFFNGYNVSEGSRIIMQRGQGGNYPLESTFSEFPLEPFVKWIKGGASKIIQSVMSSSGRKSARDNQLVVCFGTNYFYNLFYKGFDTADPESSEYMEMLWGTTPSPTPVILSFGDGVFGTQKTTLGNEKCIDLESGRLPCLSTLQIPTVPGLTIIPFVVTRGQNRRLDAMMRMGLFQEILGITKENQNQLQGIVFFHQYGQLYKESFLRSPIVKYLLMYLQANRHVSMAGGTCNYLNYKGTSDDDVTASGFLVIGNPETVKVSTALLEDPGLPMEKINKLTNLTTHSLTETEGNKISSFGLIFGSMERGRIMYGSPGLEANYLTNLLPNTQMIGGYMERQFCSEKLNSGGVQTIATSNATAFILVSYKRPNTV